MSSTLPVNVEGLTKCSYCGSQLKEALRLPCGHVACKQCLHGQNKAGRIDCIICKTTHVVQNGDMDKTFMPSALTNFWIKLNQSHFDRLVMTDEEKAETEGICPTCPPIEKPKPKKGAENLPVPEPLPVKLAFCFHCGKKICESCRTKHYTYQRQTNLTLAEGFQTGCGNVTVVCDKLNESRVKKIAEYQKMKADINARKLELSQRLDQEEKELCAKIDAEMESEKLKIKNTDYDSKSLATCKEGAKNVRDRLISEKNTKRLSELCNEFSKTQEEWNSLLQVQVAKHDPNKEKRIIFTPTKLKEEIVGTIDVKKENLKLKQANIPTEKSSVCTIL